MVTRNGPARLGVMILVEDITYVEVVLKYLERWTVAPWARNMAPTETLWLPITRMCVSEF